MNSFKKVIKVRNCVDAYDDVIVTEMVHYMHRMKYYVFQYFTTCICHQNELLVIFLLPIFRTDTMLVDSQCKVLSEN